MSLPDSAASFNPLRPRLLRIAYRMLGSLTEAEDIVQEAYIRWHQTNRSEVANAEAFLTRTVSRLCLDFIKSARVRRETYIGPWLPEPVFEPVEENADDITLTLMVALERLSPLERGAFLLHDVFGMSFCDIATTLDRDASACRKLAERARAHIRDARPRFPVTASHGQDIANAFFTASRSGDISSLKGLLSADVVVYADGGGKANAALNPIFGQDKAIRLFCSLAKKADYAEPALLHKGTIDGEPGFVTMERLQILQSTAFSIDQGRITAVYIIRNPDKLRQFQMMETAPDNLH